MRASSWRLPLVPTLVVAGVIELLLHRVMLQFLQPKILQPESQTFRLFNEGIGPLAFFFASLIALVSCTWLLIDIVRDERLFGLPWRIVLGLFSCILLPIATVGCLVSTAGLRMESSSLVALLPYLILTFVTMVAVVATGMIWREGPVFARIGLFALVVPLFLFAYYRHRELQKLTLAQPSAASFEPLKQASNLAQYGRVIYAMIGFWAFLCFRPLATAAREATARPRDWWERARRLIASYVEAFTEVGPLLVALGVAVAFGIFVKLDYATARSAVEFGVALHLPPPSGAALLHVASLCLFVLTVAGLAWRPGPPRMVAAGLLVLVLAGFNLTEPLHFLMALVGVLAVSRGIAESWDRTLEAQLAAASPKISGDHWARFIQGVVLALSGGRGDHLTTSRQDDAGTDMTRLTGTWRGCRIVLLLARREQRLLSLNITLGDELEQRADWSATMRAPRPNRSEGDDRRLVMHDRAALSDRLFQGTLPDRLRQLVRGKVDVWLHIGVRYRATAWWSEDLIDVVPLEALERGGEAGSLPLGKLLALCDLLYDLARGAGVPGADPDETDADARDDDAEPLDQPSATPDGN